MGQGSDSLDRRQYDVSPVDAGYEYTAPVDDDVTAATQQIEAEIEETRAQLSDTINAIQERLSPQHLTEQAKDAVYEATIGKAKGVGSNMFETIKQNPLPAAIAALSIGWLFRKGSSNDMSNNRYASNQYAYRGYEPQRYQPYDQYGYQGGYQQPPYYNDQSSPGITDRVSNVAGNVKDQAQNIAGNVKDQAQNIAGNVKDQAQDIASNVRDQAEYYGDQALEQVEEARDWLQQTMYENPMALGAVALALGTAVGLSLPGTPVENRVMGGARDTLVEKVQETASVTIDKVQSVASEATSAVQDAVKVEAREQGLTTK